jgi:uncharacterized MAPEG superfamily protein
MTIAYWCIFISALLPYVCAGLAKGSSFGRSVKNGGYDNRNPRAWLAKQTGYKARANAAQLNSFEALPFFMVAVILAHQLHALQSRIDFLAVSFVVIRIIYIALYLLDWALLRTIVWIVGMGLTITLFFLGI